MLDILSFLIYLCSLTISFTGFFFILVLIFPDTPSRKLHQEKISDEHPLLESPIPETKEKPEIAPTIIVNTTINNITNIKIKEEHHHEH